MNEEVWNVKTFQTGLQQYLQTNMEFQQLCRASKKPEAKRNLLEKNSVRTRNILNIFYQIDTISGVYYNRVMIVANPNRLDLLDGKNFFKLYNVMT